MLKPTQYGLNHMRWDGAWPMSGVLEDNLWCESEIGHDRFVNDEDIVDELTSYKIVEALNKAPVTHLF